MSVVIDTDRPYSPGGGTNTATARSRRKHFNGILKSFLAFHECLWVWMLARHARSRTGSTLCRNSGFFDPKNLLPQKPREILFEVFFGVFRAVELKFGTNFSTKCNKNRKRRSGCVPVDRVCRGCRRYISNASLPFLTTDRRT